MPSTTPKGEVARVAHFLKIASGETSASDSYKGIPIFAHKCLHGHAAGVMRQNGLLTKGTRVLELACGAGAMSQRLGDEGLTVVAIDALPENFQAKGDGLESRFADLNGRFEAEVGGTYDLIVAMEIIEHLEAPRAFLRSCFACLRPGGKMMLTMPNVDSSFAIVSLALKGTFARFEDSYLKNDGHIMPIGRHQFLAAAFDAGFVLDAEEACGQDNISYSAWPKFWMLLQAVKRLRGPNREGAISEYILSRPL